MKYKKKSKYKKKPKCLIDNKYLEWKHVPEYLKHEEWYYRRKK